MNDVRNILFILTDQQRFDSLGCNGSPVAKTPHLDRLAAEGRNFKNHFVANPVCSPSRGAIWTGRYPSRNGLWANGGTLPQTEATIPQTFAAQGFQTAHFGKLHLVPILNRVDPHPPYGFEVCEVAEGDQQYPPHDAYFNWLRQKAPLAFAEYLAELFTKGQAEGYTSKLPEELHMSTWVTERATDWLKSERDSGQPFFLSLGYFDPHHAFNPVEPYAGAFEDVEMPPPPDDAAFFENKPPHYRSRSEGMGDATRDPQRMARVQRAYHAMVHHLDTCVGRLVDALEALGLREDTVIVFSSDHGELLGDHRMLWKGPFLLDTLLKVPLVVSGGGIAGPDVEGLSSAVDFYATLPSLAGIAAADPKDGLRLLDEAGRPFPDGERGEIYAEWDDTSGGPTRCVRALRTARYKLIEYQGHDLGEFYDVGHDPGETRNLHGSDDPAIRAERDRMRDLLWHRYHRDRPETPLSPGW